MATRKIETDDNVYSKIESIVMEKVFSLEDENTKLKQDLALAQAKLEIYERIASISDSKATLGFRTTNEEGGLI